ncbi:UDP-glucose 4-epimerase [termite gut metagenome]|uniref:UDP-glucose 4-epimerase n=1 Tax=termite gut metagenome TaxID=433724 RepID=A0A5J4R233_9ZZZZ
MDNIEKITNIRPAFEQIDCCDFDTLKVVLTKYLKIKAIIHFSASKAVGESIEKPLLYYQNNIVSLINLLELMPQFDIEGFVFSFSCTVYGQPDKLPVTESAPIKKQDLHTVTRNRLMKKLYKIQLFQARISKVSFCDILILLGHIHQQKLENCPMEFLKT